MSTAGTTLFKDIAFVVYPVADVKRARSFYESGLGLKVTANWEDQWVEYDIGNSTLAITKADKDHKPGAHGPMAGLELQDFEATLAHLKANGVSIHSGPHDSPVCRSVIVRDPDSNELMLHARK